MTDARLLDDVTILDLSRLLPGPYATQLLADMGAEVIKVESPDGGDYMREYEPHLEDGTSHIFATVNRNKKSVVLDLKSDRGREGFLALAEEADAVVEGFRPGVVDRLGVGYDDVSEHNEAIVYCSVSGYGQTGPYTEAVGHDINYIGLSGVLEMTGETDEPPTLPGLPIGDYAGALMTAISVLAGLQRARSTGDGEYFDVSMTDVLVSMMSYFAPWHFHDDVPTPTRGTTVVSGKFPCYDVYETADGEYLAVGAFECKFWKNLCETLELPELANHDDHFPEGERLNEVGAMLEARFRERTLDEWTDELDITAVPWAPVNDLDDVWSDPQVAARDMVVNLPDEEGTPVVNFPVKTDGEYEWTRESYPGFGENSRDVLRRAGFSEEELDSLVEDGIVGGDE